METREEFGAITRTAKVETAAEVLAAQASALVQARFVKAMQEPRDLDVVRQKLLKDCERPSFAQVALYSKPIGNKKVTGLSIAFARAFLRHWGNNATEVTVIYDDPLKRTVRIATLDLESNATFSKDVILEKAVERKSLRAGQTPISSRINSQGERVFLVEATEEDLYTKSSAWEAKVVRQNALALLPGDIQAECEEAIRATLSNAAAKDPEAEKNKIIDAFADLGVRVADLKAYLDVEDMATLTPRDLMDLRAVYQALREGETNWREVMEQRELVRGKSATAPEKPATRAQEVAERLKRRAGKSQGHEGAVESDKPAPEATSSAESPHNGKSQAVESSDPQPSGADLFPREKE